MKKPTRYDVGLTEGRDTQAFTRLELAAVVGALAFLALLTLPSLANQRERSTRVLCVNNLRLVGQALAQWGTEHGGNMPLRTPWMPDGGTMFHPLRNNLYFQWSWISNELRSPKILACPSDAQKTPASNWSLSPDGGFVNARYQNRAVSYLMGTDVLPENRDDLVAGDRNLLSTGRSGTCSSGLTDLAQMSSGAVDSLGIGRGLHVEAGNFLFKDGRVEELSSQGFVARWLALEHNDNGAAHYLTD